MGRRFGWPGRARSDEGGRALSRDERRRFDEIARRLDHDEAAPDLQEPPVPPATAVVPARLTALGLSVVGATGTLTGIARGDVVVLAVVGIAPIAVALLLMAIARGRRSARLPSDDPPIARFWLWLTTCAETGCRNHPVHLGWCSEHAPGHDQGPDEFGG
ncbi:DUF3040 domain-containing protein [Pseudonocardia adelaidensis]|uniref:DUF3040 family protein n=1 Tax=Pseudonocardia adelaidensis TaxID=648754 RepID=A0ABP9NHU8_9PSEU